MNMLHGAMSNMFADLYITHFVSASKPGAFENYGRTWTLNANVGDKRVGVLCGDCMNASRQTMANVRLYANMFRLVYQKALAIVTTAAKSASPSSATMLANHWLQPIWNQ